MQYELKQRKESGRWTSSAHCFSGKIFCGECGGLYGSKVWHSNSQYRRMVWQCNEKHRGGEKCRVTHLTDEQIQAAFLAAFNRLLDSKAEILAAYDEIIRVLTDNTALDAESAELQGECDVVMELTRKCVQENAQTALNQEEYQRRYTALTERYAAARARMTDIDALRLERTAKRANIMRFLKMLVKQGDLVTEFDEELWYITVESVTVYADQRLLFTFRDGSEISIKPDIWKVA
ncbi:MAG: zinc ribbon domain-containing protein [Eubacteriales bacterium]|nr:zinc ribbon domain-containing protein [Eubacteriales bacterium]